MNLIVTIYTALLFFILTPGVLITLPRKSKKIIVVATHSLIFALIFHFTHNYVLKITNRFEGFEEGLTSAATPTTSASVPTTSASRATTTPTTTSTARAITTPTTTASVPTTSAATARATPTTSTARATPTPTTSTARATPKLK